MPRRRKRDIIIKGFSKLLKEDKLKIVAELMDKQVESMELMKSFWHMDHSVQKIFDEFSENTISNFYIPYGVAPNVIVNDITYLVPLVIEESSVVAAASSSAKFWSERGGFKAEVIDVVKIGQVHFAWKGEPWDKIEILNGKRMEPAEGMNKTILLGKCMYQAHRDNPVIREMIAVKGCPPKPGDIVKALHQAGIDVDPALFAIFSRSPVPAVTA